MHLPPRGSSRPHRIAVRGNLKKVVPAEPSCGRFASNKVKRSGDYRFLRLKTLLPCLLAIGIVGCESPSPSSATAVALPPDQPGSEILTRYFDASRHNITRGVTMAARFVGRLPQLRKEASIETRRTVAPTGNVDYQVLYRAGDNGVQKDVIARFMNAEMESTTRDTASISITPAHYKFKYRGQQDQDGRQVHVFDVNPRRKEVGLFKGEIWVDADTGLTVREAGRLVKTPSVFLKTVDFARDYEIRDGVSVPKKLHTQIMTRFWGPAEIEIDYSDYNLNPGTPATAFGLD